jgi:hypothetical protein
MMQRLLRVHGLSLILLGGCASTPPGAAPAEVGVQVICGEDLALGECPDGDLRLEIGDRSWTLDGPGGTIVPVTSARPVRIVDAAACLVLIDFEADPGHDYLVQLAEDGHATAVDLEHQDVAFESGPELAETPVSGCD